MRETKDLLQRLDGVQPPDVWRSATSRTVERAPELDRPHPRVRRALTIALTTLLSVVTVGALVVAFSTSKQAIPSPPATTPPVSPSTSLDGWTVAVSIEPARLGPLAFSVGPVEAAGSNGWAKHAFTITNVSQGTVVLGDTRTSKFLGPPPRSLIAADQGCGYGRETPTSPVQVGACLLNLEISTLRPGESRTTDISLFKDLPGMTQLTGGTYRFDQPVAYHADGPERSLLVHLSYDIEAACPAVRADLTVDRSSGPAGSDFTVSGPISYFTESGAVRVDADEQFQVWWNVDAERYADVSADAIRAANGATPTARQDGAMLIGYAQPSGACSFAAIASIPDVPPGEYPVGVLRVGGADGSTTAYGSFTMRVEG